MVKPTPAKPQQNKTTTKTAYYQSTGQYHNGSKGKYGMVAEATAGQADVKVGNKNTNVQGQAKVLTGEVKSTINTKKRSVTASLSATAVEVGGTLNHGNFGVGAKVGVGVGASGRFSMCDDQNKDGTHEVSIDVSGALLGKLGVSLRFTNPLGRFMCPSK